MPTAQISTVIQPVAPHGEFRNEPFTDFHDAENAHAMQAALVRVGDMLGHEYELIIGGERIRTAEKIKSLNPAKPSQVVGIHQKAGLEHAERAMRAALDAFSTWQYAAVEERAALLLQTAKLIRKRKFQFCAWLTYEVGKNFAEADADVAETIDFLEFYAREALAAGRPRRRPSNIPASAISWCISRSGVCAVIPPWNFPFAIMAGMTAAAIVTGNTVILKPSSDSPTIAARFLDVLEEAGMPPGVVNFCPGSGSELWQRDCGTPQNAGSSPLPAPSSVGLDIHARAAQTKPGQIWIKRTFLEMGGKDSIIVSTRLPIWMPRWTAWSARPLGSAGRSAPPVRGPLWKMPLYDVFLERVQAKVEGLRVGDPTGQPDTWDRW